VEPVADLDALAASLRERLLAESARDGPGEVEGRIRALVEREAALLDAGAREALVARVAERSVGLAPLEPLLRDPGVHEVMWSARGAWSAPTCASRRWSTCAMRSSASWRRWVVASTRRSRCATRGCPTGSERHVTSASTAASHLNEHSAQRDLDLCKQAKAQPRPGPAATDTAMLGRMMRSAPW